MEGKIGICVIDDSESTRNEVYQRLRTVEMFDVDLKHRWNTTRITDFVVNYEIINSDCSGTGFDKPEDMGKMLWDNRVFLKVILHSGDSFSTEKEIELIGFGFLACIQKGSCHYCDVLRNHPFLLEHFLEERTALLKVIEKEKSALMIKKYLRMANNIFEYYMQLPSMVEKHKGEYIALVNGRFVGTGEKEADLVEKVLSEHKQDVFLVRKVEPILT